jgi:hypothetical protein
MVEALVIALLVLIALGIGVASLLAARRLTRG